MRPVIWRGRKRTPGLDEESLRLVQQYFQAAFEVWRLNHVLPPTFEFPQKIWNSARRDDL